MSHHPTKSGDLAETSEQPALTTEVARTLGCIVFRGSRARRASRRVAQCVGMGEW